MKLLQQLTEISRRISCILPVKLCMKNNTCPVFFSPCLSRIQSALLACRGTENYCMPRNKKIPAFPRVQFDIPWENFSPNHCCFSFQVLEPQVYRNVDNSILALRGFQPGPLAIYRHIIQQMSYRKSFEDLHFSNVLSPVTTGTLNSFLFSSYPRGILLGQSQIFASKSNSEWADSHRKKAAASPQFTFLLFSPPKF